MFYEFVTGYEPENDVVGAPAVKKKRWININSIISFHASNGGDTYNPSTLEYSEDMFCINVFIPDRNYKIYELTEEEFKRIVFNIPKNIPYQRSMHVIHNK